MKRTTAFASVLVLGLLTWNAWADDICSGREEQAALARAQTQLAQAAKSGSPQAQFMAHLALVRGDCAPQVQLQKSKSEIQRLSKQLAAKSESQGFLYSAAPVSASGAVSAFAWLDAAGDFAGADAMMLKAVRARPDDIELFRTAWKLEERRKLSSGYQVNPAYRNTLTQVARDQVQRLTQKEGQIGAAIAGGSGGELSSNATQSLALLKQAAAWTEFLSGGKAPLKQTAEKRGDQILARKDASLLGSLAIAFYEFAESPKAKTVSAQQDAKMRDVEATGAKTRSMVKEKDAHEQQKFKKGADDLEKELGF